MDLHYVYRITNLINGKYYIGKHSTTKIDDGYLGSGKHIKAAIKKYGWKNFKKEILTYHDSSNDAYDEEVRLISEHINDRKCYNISDGKCGPGYGDENHQYGKPGTFTGKKHSVESRKLMSKRAFGNKNAPTSAVQMLAKDGTLIKEFYSCADAGEYVGKGRIKGSIVIARCARGIKPTAYGYKWKYIK